jgi:hypothetical protein
MYVVYRHLRADTREVIYYGAGTIARPFDLYTRIEEHRNIATSCGIVIEIVKTFDLKKDAHALERQLIRAGFANNEHLFNANPEHVKRHCEVIGHLSKELKVGVHARSVSKMKEDGIKGGIAAYHTGKGIGSLSSENLSELGKVGGKLGGPKGGKSTGSQKWKCDSCGMITTLGALGKHQNAKSHIGKTRII